MLHITAFYGGLLAVLYLILSARVIAARRDAGTDLDRRRDAELFKLVRVQGNFTRYVPLTLILMALAESMAPPRPLIHLTGLLLLAGRLLHAYGASVSPPMTGYRFYGATLTLAAMALAAVICLSLSALFIAV